jgi:hypothetical protein
MGVKTSGSDFGSETAIVGSMGAGAESFRSRFMSVAIALRKEVFFHLMKDLGVSS